MQHCRVGSLLAFGAVARPVIVARREQHGEESVGPMYDRETLLEEHPLGSPPYRSL